MRRINILIGLQWPPFDKSALQLVDHASPLKKRLTFDVFKGAPAKLDRVHEVEAHVR